MIERRHMNSDVNDEVEAFKRNLLSKRLALCTEEQQARFHKWFSTVPEDNLVNAISLVNRTIKKGNPHD